jgi:hypothetical protein
MQRLGQLRRHLAAQRQPLLRRQQPARRPRHLDQFRRLEGPVFQIWNAVTGSSKTVTFEIQSNATLNNDDFCIDIEELASGSYPLATLTDTLPDSLLTANAAITTSSAAWDSSVGSPVYQKLAVTFTPQMVGLIIIRPRMFKVSQTVYFDPKPVVT